ncbi:MAG: hypothetical protein GX033_02895 [Firmicutes bacterium]|nr:hypothetical protein [Bacillota bacterium]
MWRKQLAVLLAVVLITTGLSPTIANADSPMKLEQAIRLAKAAFPQLELEKADFISDFVVQEDKPVWQLTWSADDGMRVRIAVHAISGRILEYNHWEQTTEEDLPPLPKQSEEEALAKAEAFLKRLAPEEFAQCRYQPGQPLRPYLRERNHHLTYNFNFQRYANDIPFNYNGLRVSVNADTGDVTGYSYVWTEGPVPKPVDLIGADKAATIAQEEGKMELQYYLPYDKPGETPKPILVYQAPKINIITVDAFTGEILAPSLSVPPVARDAEYGKAAADELSPAELKEVALVEGLLTQEEAETKAREIFAIEDTYKVQDARLMANWQFPEQRQWHLSFATEDEEQRSHVAVTLDAETSEIYRYYTTLPWEKYENKGTLSWDEAEKLARDYLRKMNPAKAQQVELVKPETIDQEENQLLYYFTYRRLVNGIPFPQNGFNVTVYAGDEPAITSYNLNWQELKFPGKQGALSLEQAHAKLRQTYPFRLEYRVPEQGVRPLPVEGVATAANAANRGSKVSNPISLVYTQAPVPSTMFRATDGQPLNYQGEPIQEDVITLPKDIAGHPAEQDIAYLAKVGILPVPTNGKYRPDEVASTGDWLELLANAMGSSSDQQMDRLTKGQASDKNQPLKREELALYAIRALGHDRIASMSDIFFIAVPDADEVSEEYTGHVAIALKLELLQLREGNFAPQATATLAELATALMQMFRLER